MIPDRPLRPDFARCCLAAAHSGSGKTTLAAGLLRACVRRGLLVQGFKCGPDYVDPTFHAQASGRAVYNLDTWMMGRAGVRRLFARHVADADVAVCEGVMGLIDGREVAPGAPDGSTLDCAATLGLPLILVVNARGMGASVAPLVAGFTAFAAARGVSVVGVVANQCGSTRHTGMLRTALTAHGLPPLLGALPRDPRLTLPERQLGLVPAAEAGFAELLETLADAVEAHVDIDALLAATRGTRPEFLQAAKASKSGITGELSTSAPRKVLAVADDAAFCFRYEENEAALRRDGWQLVYFSPLCEAVPAQADALYLCGGYPEVFADQLAANKAFIDSVQAHAAAGKEIWAECGGYMTLCRELVTPEGRRLPMTGVLKATAHMGERLRSLGYREVQVRLPFGLSDAATAVRGHEFHWSRVELHEPLPPLYPEHAAELGVQKGSVRAGYVHLYWGDADSSATDSPDSDTSHTADATHHHQHQHHQPPLLTGGRVIVLNGPSSAGKTSLAHALRRVLLSRCGRASMVISMDDFLRGCAGESTVTAAPVLPVVEACHAAVAEAARRGALVIADHVIGEDPNWQADLFARLAGIPVHGVQVTCRPEELVRREHARQDRPPDAAHALRQHADIHCPLPRPLWVDTSDSTPESCADAVLDQIMKTLSVG